MRLPPQCRDSAAIFLIGTAFVSEMPGSLFRQYEGLMGDPYGYTARERCWR